MRLQHSEMSKIKWNFLIALQLHQYNKRKEYNAQKSIYQFKTAILHGMSARQDSRQEIANRMKSQLYSIQREWTCYFNNLQTFNNDTQISGTAHKSKVLLIRFWCTKCFNYNRSKVTVSWGTFQLCPCLGKSVIHNSLFDNIPVLALVCLCHWPFYSPRKSCTFHIPFNKFWAIGQLAQCFSVIQRHKSAHVLLLFSLISL